VLQPTTSLNPKPTPILTLNDVGLDSKTTNIEQAAKALETQAEAPIVRWVQFPRGALFFTMHDPQSGFLYVFDRKSGTFYSIDFEDNHFGGYTIEQYEQLVEQYQLKRLAACPWLLTRGFRRRRRSFLQ
jgi:hypothetical protein